MTGSKLAGDHVYETALVTGASGALGGAVAEVLDRRGCRVAVHYASNKEAAAAVAARLVHAPIEVHADVADWHQVKDMTDEVLRAFGRVDVLVNCAGIRRDFLLAGQGVEEWRHVIEVNLLGTFHVTRALVPMMLRARKGAIINVVSPAALFGNPGQSAYCASKAGVVGLTRALAHECGRRGVTVNALSPGFMETPMTAGVPADIQRQILERTPMRRAGGPEEIAETVSLMLDASYMTGQVISIDGGLTA
ncbi:MAG: 3-oxoacyl-ACP reductase family protein [Acidimicrobiales bacterium]